MQQEILCFFYPLVMSSSQNTLFRITFRNRLKYIIESYYFLLFTFYLELVIRLVIFYVVIINICICMQVQKYWIFYLFSLRCQVAEVHRFQILHGVAGQVLFLIWEIQLEILFCLHFSLEYLKIRSIVIIKVLVRRTDR